MENQTMKTQHAIAATALWLLAAGANAYQIVEGRYRVEVAPGVFQDQLVVRCDDGESITVPWDTKLAEACGESLMGESSPQRRVSKSLADDKAQQEAMLTQVRAQFGNVSERYVEFKPGPDGLAMRFRPPMSDILKKYELCRKSRDRSADCAAERDRALAALGPAGTTPPLKDAPSRAAQPELQSPSGAAPAPPRVAVMPASNSVARAAPEPSKAMQLPPSQPPAADRAAAEQRIAAEHSSCMRAKPKYECEQARAKALSALDKPAAKPAKAKRAAKSPTPAPQVTAKVD
jgi:hypothetical protein